MKKTILRLGMIAVAIIMLSSGKCDGVVGPYTDTEANRTCKEKYTEVYDFLIGTVNLEYDITGIDDMAKIDLNKYHNFIFYNERGVIRSLSDIITEDSFTSNLSESDKASLKINQTGTDCRGNISKTVTDHTRVIAGKIMDITNMGTSIKELKLELKTVTCRLTWPNVVLMWSEVLGNNERGFDAAYTLPVSSKSFLKLESDGIYLRPRSKNEYIQEYEVVGGDLNDIPNEIDNRELRPVDISGSQLNKPIYMGDKVNSNVLWNAPLVCIR